MKKAILISVLACLLIACGVYPEENHRGVSHRNHLYGRYDKPIGGKKDAYGCLASAGYTWSVLRRDCIRVFEVGIRLDPVNVRRDEAIISAFIVRGRDQMAVELFLPYKKRSLILQQTRDGRIYRKGKYLYDDRRKELYINNRLQYSYR